MRLRLKLELGLRLGQGLDLGVGVPRSRSRSKNWNWSRSRSPTCAQTHSLHLRFLSKEPTRARKTWPASKISKVSKMFAQMVAWAAADTICVNILEISEILDAGYVLRARVGALLRNLRCKLCFVNTCEPLA